MMKLSSPFLFAALLLCGLLAGNSVSAQSNHTVTFTGNATDFTAATEKISAGSGAVDYYATFDATYMYFGAFRTGNNAWGANDHFTIYVDADPRSAPTTAGNGSTAGVLWDANTPTLPFRADYRVAMRVNNSGESFYHSNNTTSGTANWSATTAANAKGYTQFAVVGVNGSSNGAMEIRVPLSDFGNPASVYFSLFSTFNTANTGFFAPGTGTITSGAGGTFTVNNYFGKVPVYKSGVSLFTTTTTPITDLTLSASGALTAGDYGDISTSAATTNTLSGNTSFSGTLTVGTTVASRIGLSTFTLYVGGRGFGGTAGQILLNGSSGAPFTTGAGGTVNFLGAGLLGGTTTATSFVAFPSGSTVIINGAVDFGNVGATTPSGLAGTLQINAGGSVNTNPPTYNSGSTLIYNTGTTYTAGAEWTTASTSAKGVPQAVTIQNNTLLNFGSSGAYRQANALVTIASGSSLTLSSAAFGDLKINAGLTNSNAGAGVGINTNGRAIFVPGSGTYTKNGTTGGTDNIDIIIFGTNPTLTLANNTNLNLTNTTAAGCVQFGTSAGSGIVMAGTNTLTIGAGCTVIAGSTASITGASATTSILSFAGTATIGSTAVLTVAATVGTQINAGLTVTNAGKFVVGNFQINQGGFIGGTNPLLYTSPGTLIYNHNATTGVYGVQALEWPAASGPTSVTVNANGGTGISFGTNNITARTLTGTLTVAAGQNVSLTGTGTPNLTVLNTTAGAGATISGTGTYTHTASGTFTTANTGGINGTLTTSGAVTLPTTTSFVFNNATASQVTGTLLPATIAALTINNPTAATGTTISNNTLVISGTTTLTAGALVLPTGVSNLVTMTGALSAVTGTITGSATSNLINTGGASTSVGFTSGAASLFNWSVPTSSFGSSSTVGLSSVVTINGTFSLAASSVPDIYTTSTGGLIIANGAFYTDNTTTGNRVLGAGIFTVQSGGSFSTGHTSGLSTTAATGAVQVTGTRTFSGGGNYTFNSTTLQAIGDVLDAAGGTGKTGVITGNVIVSGNPSGLTLNAGTTITINTPGSFTLGTNTSAALLIAPATSIINGSGNITFLGNGATSGSSLTTAHANGVNGTFPGTGTFSLTNGANNNTNFTFNGSVAQTTGALMPAIVSNLSFLNTFSGALATPSVTLSSSVTANGTTTFAGGTGVLGLVSIGGSNTLTLNGAITYTNVAKLIGTATSNLIIGGTGTIGASSLFATGGGALNNFTMNRTGQTILAGVPLIVSGTFSLTAGVVSMSTNTLTLNGPIALGAGTLTSTGPLTIGGSGAITGNLTGTASPLTLSALTMNRSGANLSLGSNVTISGATGLSLTAGNVTLGAFNLTSTSATGQLGAGSTTSMLVATGTGQAFNTIPITGFIAQTWPIGDGTNYTPVVLTFSANAVGGTVGVKTVASTHPSINVGSTPVASIARYWTFSNTALTTYTYSGTFKYISPGDVTGVEASLKLSRYNGSAWTEYAGSSVASPVLSSGSLTETSGPLSLDYTGRANVAAVSYVWNGLTSNDWNTAANWTPAGVPAAIDNVTINVPGISTNCSINSGSFSVANFTLNGTGAFNMASGTTLTISGTVTYGGSATAAFDCASTLNITSAVAQTIPALNYGNLNLTGGARTLASSGTIGICGVYTPGAGAITTTGSTVNFNGSGTQTIPATNFNNLSSSSTGARTLPNGGTITVAGTFAPGSNTYTNTGSTVALTSTTGFNLILPTVGSGNSFNILTINGTGGIFNMPYSASTQNLATTLNVTAGTFVLNPATSTLTNTVAVGTININGGTLDDRAVITGLSTTLQVTTAWNHTSGTVTNTSTNGTDKIQFTGGGATTYSGLTSGFSFFGVQVSNNTTLTLSNTLTINGLGTTSLTVDAGSTLNAGTTVVSSVVASGVSGGFVINGTFKTGNLIGFSGSTTTALNTVTNTPTVTLGSASTVDYTSTGASPVITGRLDYANLTVSGSSTTFAFNGNSTLTGNYSQTAGTVTLTSAASALSLTVGGTFIQSAGTFNVTGSAATAGATVTVTGATSIFSMLMEANSANTASTVLFQANGNATFTGSSTTTAFDWMAGGTSGTAYNITFGIKGNFNWSNTTGRPYTSGSGSATGFVFNGTGTTASPQTLTYSGSAITFGGIFAVSAGTVVKLLTSVALGTGTNPYNTFAVNGGTLDVQGFVISGGNVTVATSNLGFTLASGATLITSNTAGVTTSVTAALTNYNAAANYTFNGSAAQNTNFPAAVAAMNNLIINNSTADVKINQSIAVNGDLTLTAGNLDLNGSFNITLGATSTLQTETSTKLIKNSGTPTAGNGWIGTNRTVNAPSALNVANLGATLTTVSNLGTTFIKRFPKAIAGVGSGASGSIARHYSIAPTSAGTGATLTFSYFDAELNSNSETAPTLVLFNSISESTGYGFIGATSVDATANTVTFGASASISATPTFWTAVNTSGYQTAADGDWNTGSTWAGGAVPPANIDITINHLVTVNSVDPSAVNNLTIGSGASASLTIASGRTVTINTGKTFTNSSSNPSLGASGTITFAGTGTVSGTSTFGNVIISAGVNFGTTSTIGTSLQINAGGFVNTNAVTYGGSSTLIYNSGGTYGRSVEWNSTSGAGYPNNVQIGNGVNTTLDVINGGNTYKKAAGNLTVSTGSTFSIPDQTVGNGVTGIGVEFLGNIINDGTISLNTGTNTTSQRLKGVNLSNGNSNTTAIVNLSGAVGGDIELTGNYLDNAVFNANTRAVFFTGTGIQTIGGTATAPFNIDYIVVTKASGSVQMLTNLLTEGPNGGNAITLSSATDILDLNGRALTLGKAGVASTISGTGVFKGSAASSLTVLGTGAFGTIRFDQTTGAVTNVLQNLTIGTTGTATLGNSLYVFTAAAFNSGVFDITGNTLRLGGTVTAGGGTITVGTSAAVLFNGTIAQSIPSGSLFTGNTAYTINIANPAGVNFTGSMAISNALQVFASGVFIPAAAAIISGAGTLTGLDVTSSVAKVTRATGTADFTTQYSLNKTLTNIIIEFAGAGAQGMLANTFGGLKINNSNGVTMAGDVTVGAGLNLNVGNLSIGSNTLTLSSAVTRTSGNLTGSNTSNLAVNGTAGSLFFTSGTTNNYLKTLTIGAAGSATLGNALNITAYDGVSTEGVLTVTSGGTLASAGFLAIKSDINGTARIAAGNTSGGYITGDVSVERYIRQNSNKAWRLLASNTTGQTINQSWQESSVGDGVNPNAGFGTIITGRATTFGSLAAAQAAGYDAIAAGAGLYKYNPTTDNLDLVPNTNSTSLASEQGYFIFIRGNRAAGSIDLGTATAPTTSAVLRSKGTLFLGNQSAVSTGALNWGLVRNPYPSRIDMRNIVRSPLLTDAYQVWDSKLGGSFGVGGYQTFTKSGADYFITPGGGSYGISGSIQNFIESGAAFFIQSSGGAGTAQVTENCKASSSSNVSFRPSSPAAENQRFNSSLYAVNAGSTDLVDANLILLDAANSNAVDINDVRKSPNFGENFGLRTAGIDLVVERRALFTVTDTIFYHMSGMRVQSYKIEILPTAITTLDLAAFLEDKYLGTSSEVSLVSPTQYVFVVDANAGSKAGDRFRIVFRPIVVVPVTFTAIKAVQAGNNIAVEWKVANQINIASYEVMKSTDGRNFTSVATLAARNINSSSITYNWLDENVVTGANYFRIKSVDNSGQLKYTEIVKVIIGKGSPAFSVSPNPVQGNLMNLQFVNQPAGKYSIRLINVAGQLMYSNVTQHAGGSSSQSFDLPSSIIRGVYQLEVIAPDNTKQVQKLIITAAN